MYENAKIRVKISLKAEVLGILLHSEQESNLRGFFGVSKFHPWCRYCDGWNKLPTPGFFNLLVCIFYIYFKSFGLKII